MLQDADDLLFELEVEALLAQGDIFKDFDPALLKSFGIRPERAAPHPRVRTRWRRRASFRPARRAHRGCVILVR